VTVGTELTEEEEDGPNKSSSSLIRGPVFSLVVLLPTVETVPVMVGAGVVVVASFVCG